MRFATAAERAFAKPSKGILLGTRARCKAANRLGRHVRQAPCSELVACGRTRWRLLRARRTLEPGAAVSVEQGLGWAGAPGARQPRNLRDICARLPARSWPPELACFQVLGGLQGLTARRVGGCPRRGLLRLSACGGCAAIKQAPRRASTEVDAHHT